MDIIWTKCPHCGELCDQVTIQDHLEFCADGYDRLPTCERCGYRPDDGEDGQACPECGGVCRTEG